MVLSVQAVIVRYGPGLVGEMNVVPVRLMHNQLHSSEFWCAHEGSRHPPFVVRTDSAVSESSVMSLSRLSSLGFISILLTK